MEGTASQHGLESDVQLNLLLGVGPGPHFDNLQTFKLILSVERALSCFLTKRRIECNLSSIYRIILIFFFLEKAT